MSVVLSSIGRSPSQDFFSGDASPFGKRVNVPTGRTTQRYVAMLLRFQWARPTAKPTQSEKGGQLWPQDLAGGSEDVAW